MKTTQCIALITLLSSSIVYTSDSSSHHKNSPSRDGWGTALLEQKIKQLEYKNQQLRKGILEASEETEKGQEQIAQQATTIAALRKKLQQEQQEKNHYKSRVNGLLRVVNRRNEKPEQLKQQKPHQNKASKK